MCEYGAALEKQGFRVIFAVGFGETSNGDCRLKVSATPGLRNLDPEVWAMIIKTLNSALHNLHHQPLNTLERKYNDHDPLMQFLTELEERPKDDNAT